MKTEIRRENILDLLNAGLSYSEIAKELNCSKSLIAFYANSKNSEKIQAREKEKIEKELFVCELAKKCLNINQICKSLGKRATNTNYRTIKEILDKYNVDVSHFIVDYTNKSSRKYTLEEVFCKDSKYTKISSLRTLLLNNGWKDAKCECCGQSLWLGKPIPLQTHHINGNNTDNRLENLQLLCPNCHAITDTYCGKNKNGAKQEGINKVYRVNKCIICGKEFYGHKKATCSDACYASYLKRRSKKYINNVTKESLLEAFKKFKTFKKVGEHFNISDSMAHRWCKEFGLPHTIKEMKKYISI